MGDMGLQGAFGNDALYQLLHQRRVEAMQAQQQQFENQRQLSADQRAQQALDLQSQLRGDALARQKQEDLIRQGNVMNEALPGGTRLDPTDPRLDPLRAAGATLTPDSGFLQSTQYGGESTLPGASKPSGFLRTTANPAVPAGILKGQSEKQLNFSIGQQQKASDSEARISHLTDQVNQAWERLRLQGDSNALRAELAQRAAELAQAKLEFQKQHEADVAAKTPQPQFFSDANGATHAVIFDKGTFKEVPLPKGYTPTKAAPPGLFDRIKGLFSSDSGTDPTDPNWGK